MTLNDIITYQLKPSGTGYSIYGPMYKIYEVITSNNLTIKWDKNKYKSSIFDGVMKLKYGQRILSDIYIPDGSISIPPIEGVPSWVWESLTLTSIDRWNHLYDTTQQEYNMIHNYEMTEQGTDKTDRNEDETINDNNTQTGTISKENTRTPNLTKETGGEQTIDKTTLDTPDYTDVVNTVYTPDTTTTTSETKGTETETVTDTPNNTVTRKLTPNTTDTETHENDTTSSNIKTYPFGAPQGVNTSSQEMNNAYVNKTMRTGDETETTDTTGTNKTITEKVLDGENTTTEKRTGNEETTVSQEKKGTGTVKEDTTTGFTNTETEKGTETNEGTDTYDLTNTNTKSDVKSVTETVTHNFSRSGNIGVTTSQQMIQSERDLWEWSFFEALILDIVNLITMPMFEF